MSRKTIIIIVAVFALIVPASLIFVSVTSEPSFCKTCHVIRDEYTSWQKSSHKDIDCLVCHQKPGATGFLAKRLEASRNFTRWLLNSYQRPVIAFVRDEPCQRCHRKEIAQGVLISEGIKVSHKEIVQEGYKCTDCHNTVTHGKAVPIKKYGTMDKCATCHNGERASKECDLCHKGKVTRRPKADSVWAIAHGKNWRRTHGMGNLATCQICHPKGRCARCHQVIDLPHSEFFPAQHGKLAKEDRKTCLRCHRENFCTSCHRTEMPHLVGWLPEHSAQAKKLSQEFCLRCHIKYDCEKCHERHVHKGYGWRFK